MCVLFFYYLYLYIRRILKSVGNQFITAQTTTGSVSMSNFTVLALTVNSQSGSTSIDTVTATNIIVHFETSATLSFSDVAASHTLVNLGAATRGFFSSSSFSARVSVARAQTSLTFFSRFCIPLSASTLRGDITLLRNNDARHASTLIVNATGDVNLDVSIWSQNATVFVESTGGDISLNVHAFTGMFRLAAPGV